MLKTSKKMLAWLLAVMMFVSIVPISSFAWDTGLTFYKKNDSWSDYPGKYSAYVHTGTTDYAGIVLKEVDNKGVINVAKGSPFQITLSFGTWISTAASGGTPQDKNLHWHYGNGTDYALTSADGQKNPALTAWEAFYGTDYSKTIHSNITGDFATHNYLDKFRGRAEEGGKNEAYGIFHFDTSSFPQLNTAGQYKIRLAPTICMSQWKYWAGSGNSWNSIYGWGNARWAIQNNKNVEERTIEITVNVCEYEFHRHDGHVQKVPAASYDAALKSAPLNTTPTYTYNGNNGDTHTKTTYTWPTSVNSSNGGTIVVNEVATNSQENCKFGRETVIDAATCANEGHSSKTCEYCQGVKNIVTPKSEKHSGEKTLPAVPATCTETGLEAGVECTVCGQIVVPQKETPMIPHNYSKHDAKAPTCDQPGNKDYWKCTVCKKVFDYETYEEVSPESVIIEKTSIHTQGTPATCTKSAVCSVCGQEYGEPLGHNYQNVEAREPSCANPGWNAYQKCSRCGENNKVEIPATGRHVVGVEATCKTRAKCDICGQYFGSPDPSKHNFETYVSNNDATCLKDGTKTARCKNGCGETDTIDDPKTKKEHSYTGEPKSNGNGTHSLKCVNGCDNYGGETECSGTEATCSKKAVCSTCNAEFGDYNENNHKNTTVLQGSPADCGHDGLGEGLYCNDCKKTVKNQELIPATGKHTVGTPANCVDKALCSVCGQSFGDIDSDNHKHIVDDPLVEPSCGTPGHQAGKKCDACGVVTEQGAEIPATQSHQGGKATCTEQAKCDICGTPYGELADHEGGEASCTQKAICDNCHQPYGELLPHEFENFEAKNPTCTEVGWDAYQVCKNCKLSTKEEIPATGHSMTKTEAKEPTCEENGNDAYWYCSNCEKYFKDGDGNNETTLNESIKEAKGHDYKETDKREPSCTEEGYITYTCQNDSTHTYTEKIAKLHHVDEDRDGFCDKCGNPQHNFTTGNDRKVYKEATCTETGLLCHYCEDCGEFDVEHDTVIIPVKPHELPAEPTTVTPRTCTEPEKLHYNCVNCGTQVVKDGKDAIGHSAKWKVTVESCSSSVGESELTCDRCGEVLDVKYGATASHHVVYDDPIPATCMNVGYTRGSHCDVCGEVILAPQATEKAPHYDGNHDGLCDNCLQPLPTQPGGGSDHSCICHKDDFFNKIIFSIAKVFWKLFKINKVCACGSLHY